MNHYKILKFFVYSLLMCFLFSCQEQNNGSVLRVKKMRCEYLDNPLGIDQPSPRLSWQISGLGVRGEKQTAYHIRVASSLDKLEKGKPDLWDSEQVSSDKSTQVAYKGKTLESRMKCYWQVRIWDQEGKPSAWSNPSYWTMGLLKQEDWQAQWIGSPTPTSAPYYRHSFELDNVPKSAPLYLAALGYFELYINGKKVGNEILAPAVSNFSKRSYYKTYEVAHYLKKGKNSIGIWMGTGWYSPGLPGVEHHSPVVRAQLEITNSKKQQIITDPSWQTKESDRSLIGEWRWGKFGGELVDARLNDPQWWDTVKTSEDWQSVIKVKTAAVSCTAQKSRNNITLDPITPVSIESLDDTTVMVDFGTNLTGILELQLYGLTRGEKITLHYADFDGRDPNEAWRISNMNVKGFSTYNQRDEYISAGKQREQFKNVFNYHGFRYVLIEGLDYLPEKDDMVALPVETEVPEVGSFLCSNDLYNRIHKMVRWTYRALNLGGQTVDCPHRERVGYGDGQTIMDVGCYNFDAATLYTKWSQNWWDEQHEDGFVPFVAPTPHPTGGGPAWGAMSILVPWKTYLFYNDKKLLENGYPFMKRYIEYLGSNSENGILKDLFPGEKWHNLGDWVPPGRGMDKKDWVDDHSRRFFNNCFRTHLLQTMIKVGTILGKTKEVEVFQKELKIAQHAIHQKWFNAKDNTYANGEQPYLIFPLQTGITPDELQEAVFEKYIRTMMVKDKGHLNSGMMGTQITFDYLLENNRNDLIDIMVNQKTYPGWGYMVEKGATSCWEQWNGYYSQIHSCFPYIGGWFYRGLAGIQWDTNNPGFKNIVLRPALVNSVDWVNCSYESPYGEIVSNWKKEAGEFIWEVSIPPNSTATVYLPGEETLVDGEKISRIREINFIRNEGNTRVFKVESGEYIFNTKLSN
jgi:alpha-L-rhamnosidase